MARDDEFHVRRGELRRPRLRRHSFLWPTPYVQPIRIALVGDFARDITAHRAINESMRLAGASMSLEPRWLHTSTLQPRDEKTLAPFDGIWCVPGSPYTNTVGALWAIEWARICNAPFLGTCGGFQHALLEFARHVLDHPEAAHAETDPTAPVQLISPLACALVEKPQRIIPTGKGRFSQWYGPPRDEGFHCSFGLNPACEAWLEKSGLEIVARNEAGEARAVELLEHKFFVGTLFQPERTALTGELHSLVDAFLHAAANSR
jgi:CTP synthase (UTP-ammonia lyase)